MAINYEVQVVHPTFNGDRVSRWEVIIHYIEERDETSIGLNGEQTRTRHRLAFRGSARIGDWVGKKTFFVDQCSELLVVRTGRIFYGPDAISARLRQIASEFEQQARERECARLGLKPGKSPIEGKNICIVGEFKNIDYHKKCDILLHLGARQVARDDPEMDMLVHGSSGVSPRWLKKVAQLGLKPMTEEEFLILIGYKDAHEHSPSQNTKS